MKYYRRSLVLAFGCFLISTSLFGQDHHVFLHPEFKKESYKVKSGYLFKHKYKKVKTKGRYSFLSSLAKNVFVSKNLLDSLNRKIEIKHVIIEGKSNYFICREISTHKNNQYTLYRVWYECPVTGDKYCFNLDEFIDKYINKYNTKINAEIVYEQILNNVNHETVRSNIFR